MQIRDATKKDLATVWQINKDNVPHVGTVDITWFERYLTDAFYFRVIEVKSKVVGFMVAMIPSTDYLSENFLWFKKNYASFVYVDRIAIAVEHVGQGLGRKLYQDIEKFMRSESTLLTCEVNLKPANPESLEFHKKLGFQELGTLETKGGTITVCLLGKTLRP